MVVSPPPGTHTHLYPQMAYYILKSFISFKNFRVQDPLQIINEHAIAIDSSIPDHRILTTELVGGPVTYDRKRSMHKKVNITVPADFMSDASPVQEIEGSQPTGASR